MVRIYLLLFFCIYSFFGAIIPTQVSASAKTDYEYQLAQYRKNLAEFTQLKRDYLQNPTLDNQQKSIIVVKQALQARDLSKASYARFLAEEIQARNTAYVALDPILIKLVKASEFYFAESTKSAEIITPADLRKFSATYSKNTVIHDRSFFYGQVGVKVAQLVRFQIDAKNILDTIYPKLPTPAPAPLKARLEDIPGQAEMINQKIDLLTSKIIPEEEEGPIMGEQYFNKIVENLSDIRQMEARLIDQFIDIDINYAKL